MVLCSHWAHLRAPAISFNKCAAPTKLPTRKSLGSKQYNSSFVLFFCCCFTFKVVWHLDSSILVFFCCYWLKFKIVWLSNSFVVGWHSKFECQTHSMQYFVGPSFAKISWLSDFLFKRVCCHVLLQCLFCTKQEILKPNNFTYCSANILIQKMNKGRLVREGHFT